MITEAVLVPQPPLLFRELSGLEDVGRDVRLAAVGAVHEAAAGAGVVSVVGAAERAGAWDPTTPPDVHAFGAPDGGTRSGLPLSLGVGRRLLDEVAWTGTTELVALPGDATTLDLKAEAERLRQGAERRLVLLTGDGSTRRGDTAPGFLDERAFGFDDGIAAALASGDAETLRNLDTGLADELMVLGSMAFRLLGWLGPPDQAELAYRGDPFGVSYFVARWSFTDGR
ncbi:MAG: hypothetical protein ACRDPI_01695 [Nocardioidaceae bacterium]